MVLVEFETGAYALAEDAGELVVCLTKDKMATVPISLSLTPVETIPPSATGREYLSPKPTQFELVLCHRE